MRKIKKSIIMIVVISVMTLATACGTDDTTNDKGTGSSGVYENTDKSNENIDTSNNDGIAQDIGKDAVDGVEDIGKDAVDGVEDIGKDIKDGVEDMGNGMESETDDYQNVNDITAGR